MKNPEKLCLGCMEPLERAGDTCPVCGFNREKYEEKRSTRALPSYTILAGKYLLGRVLGEGGFGITYLAWDLNRECKTAIKEYFPNGLASRDTTADGREDITVMSGEKKEYYQTGLRNFAEEGRNLLRFQELKGIVSVRDFFQDNGTAYLVMDYAEGTNLKQYLHVYYVWNGEGAPIAQQEVLEMMHPVLQALKEVHKAGIIHRDISPENIIRGKDGKVTLIDFGAARMITGSETKSLTIMLKHGYAPPEQYRTKGNQGPWTDIYALCATMYHMMTGHIPPESIDRVFEDELRPACRVNPSISKHVSDVLEKGMSVRSEHRFQTIEEVESLLYPQKKKQTSSLSKPVERQAPQKQPQEQLQEQPQIQPVQVQTGRPQEKKEEIKQGFTIKQLTALQRVSLWILIFLFAGFFVFREGYAKYILTYRIDMAMLLSFACMIGGTFLICGGLSAGISILTAKAVERVSRNWKNRKLIWVLAVISIAAGVAKMMAPGTLPVMRISYWWYGILYFCIIQGACAWPGAYWAIKEKELKTVKLWCVSAAGVLAVTSLQCILGLLREFFTAFIA